MSDAKRDPKNKSPTGVRWVTMDDRGQPVASLGGLVYRTKPRIAGGSDGNTYFIKGPALEIVVAEAVGHELAATVQLEVPAWAFCHLGDDDEVFFASRAMRIRSGVDSLIAAGIIENPEFLSACIAFDTWTSNRDRNVNNVVAEPVGSGKTARVRLVAIDFEQADILRGVDRFTVTAFSPSLFRPTGDLARHCTKLPFPETACSRISGISGEAIHAMFQDMQGALSPQSISWIDSASDFLATRAKRIGQLVREVWRA